MRARATLSLAIAALILPAIAPAQPALAVDLAFDDILVADADAFGGSGGVIRVNPPDGAQTTVSQGGSFSFPAGIALEADGKIVVADVTAAAVFRVDPATGVQTTVSSGGSFVTPLGIAVEADGDILVADLGTRDGPGSVIRVNPTTGAQTTVSSGGSFADPFGIGLEADGNILVADTFAFGGTGGIIRVNPATGAQTTVSSHGSFIEPVALVVEEDGDILVADRDAAAGAGVVFRVNPTTGAQSVLASGGLLVNPTGVALDVDGNVVVSDAAEFGGSGHVVRVDPVTGAQSLVAAGGSLVEPFGIAVVPTPNFAPVAGAEAYMAAEDTPLPVAAPGLLANDTDANEDPLTAVLESGPSHGKLTLQAHGSFTYTPARNYHGPDAFTYRASDGELTSDPATVNITVTPVADRRGDILLADVKDFGPSGVIIRIDPTTGAQTAVSQDGSFSDPRGVALEADGSILVADAFALSGAVFRVDPATGAQTTVSSNDRFAQPSGIAVEQSGTILTISPMGLGRLIRVNPVTGAQSFLSSGGLFDLPLGIALEANGSILVADVNAFGGGGGIIRINPTTGAQTTVSSGGLFDDPIGVAVEADGSIVVADRSSAAGGDVIRVNPATGAQTIVTSSPDVSNALGIAVEADGTLLVASGGTDSLVRVDPATGATATVSSGGLMSDLWYIAVAPTANVGPAAADDAYAADEDTPLTLAAPGVLANDTDSDGDVLTAILDSGPANGTIAFAADGSFTYTPNADFTGSDSFTYQATDGTMISGVATVTITVGPVNDAPVAVDDAYTTDEDTLLVVPAPAVLGNDTDAEGDTLTASLVLGPDHGILTLNPDGSFTYTPDPDFHGTDTFTYAASDGTLTSNVATASVAVASVDDAPVGVDDAYSTEPDTMLSVDAPGVLANDTDPEGDMLSVWPQVGTPDHGILTIENDGSFTYTPDDTFTGTDSFTYRAFDGERLSGVTTVTITVELNLAPVAVDDAYTTGEGAPLTVDAPGVLGNDTDPNGDALVAVSGTGPTHGALSFNDDGSFLYVPVGGFTGTDSFTYRASDGPLVSNLATVTVTVTDLVNDAPVANDDAFTVDEDGTLTVDAPGVLGNDTDPEDDALSSALVALPAHGAFVFHTDGSFMYAPDADFSGADSFTYTASDGSLTSNVATVTITVNPVNDAPIAVDDAFTTDEDTPIVVDAPGVLGNDSDPEGDQLSAEAETMPEHGSLSLSPTGGFAYVPDAGFTGTDTFAYRASDGPLFSALATVTITVDAANDAPTIVVAPGGSCGSNDRSGTLNLTLVDPDDLLASLTLTATSDNVALLPNSGFVFAGGGGGRTLRATARANRTGTAIVTVVVSDGEASASLSFTVIVGDKNANLLTGTDGMDLLLGQAGNDSLSGLDEIDLLCGGKGNDSLTGGAGADRFSGGRGTDTAVDLLPADGDTQDGSIP